jgi:hypothetical protein
VALRLTIYRHFTTEATLRQVPSFCSIIQRT